jgi:hypothetical protein
MKRNSLVNWLAFKVYYLPTVLVALSLIFLTPFVVLASFIDREATGRFVSGVMAWGDRKKGEMLAARDRLRLDPHKD